MASAWKWQANHALPRRDAETAGLIREQLVCVRQCESAGDFKTNAEILSRVLAPSLLQRVDRSLINEEARPEWLESFE